MPTHAPTKLHSNRGTRIAAARELLKEQPGGPPRQEYTAPCALSSELARPSALVSQASPGTIQSGMSRELLDMWCDDKKNTVIIPGYMVKGTFAETVGGAKPSTITTLSGEEKKFNMEVRRHTAAAGCLAHAHARTHSSGGSSGSGSACPRLR